MTEQNKRHGLPTMLYLLEVALIVASWLGLFTKEMTAKVNNIILFLGFMLFFDFALDIRHKLRLRRD